MNSISQIRQACAEAMRQGAQAEQRATQARDAAARRRQAATDAARQRQSQAQQQAQALYTEILSQAQQADSVVSDLKLTPSMPTAPYQPYGSEPDELLRVLHNYAAEARATLTRLNTTTAALKAERRKWWKFW